MTMLDCTGETWQFRLPFCFVCSFVFFRKDKTMRTQKRRGERAAQREEEAIRRLPLIRYDAIEPVAVVAWRILLFLFLFFQ